MAAEVAAPSQTRTIVFRVLGTVVGIFSIAMAVLIASIYGMDRAKFIATSAVMGSFFIWGVWRKRT